MTAPSDLTPALCAIYTRLSKEDEGKDQNGSESIQNQRALLVRYAAERGWTIYRLYCDEDYSGADSLRPDFNRMIEAARQKRFQIILCKSQSRFTRDMELVEKYIHTLFPIWGIRFVAVADHTDTEIKGNKKARQINGLVNEWYLEDLSENIRMVLDLKRRQGQYIGGSPLYGYQKDPAQKNHLIPDPDAAEVVRQIFQWSLEGHGKQAIAGLLNDRGIPNPTRYKQERGWTGGAPTANPHGLWSPCTVWRILRNEMYTGVMLQGRRKKISYKSRVLADVPRDQWFRVEGTHEAIISPRLFQAVQHGLDLRARTDGSGQIHLLSGLVKCLDCGSTMSRTTNGQRGEKRLSYLRCRQYADSGKEKLCTRHSLRLDRLINVISDRLRRHVREGCPMDTLALSSPDSSRRAALERAEKTLSEQLAQRGHLLKRLYLDKVSGLLSDGQFEELNRCFLEETVRLEHRRERVREDLLQFRRQSEQEARRAQVQSLLTLEPIPRELAVLLIKKIEIGEKHQDTGQQEVRITWNF